MADLNDQVCAEGNQLNHANLNCLVKDKDIARHIPVIDKSKREDGTFSREDFTFDKDRNVYICLAILTTTGKVVGLASAPADGDP